MKTLREHLPKMPVYDEFGEEVFYADKIIDAVKLWLVESCKHWKGNNLCSERERPTIDWVIDELIEDATYPSNKNLKCSSLSESNQKVKPCKE
jgi:hypothetical protein